jgi:hypothetical protein
MSSQSKAETGRKSSIGTTTVQLTQTTEKAQQGVQLHAPAANPATIYVGTRSNITADSNDLTDGFPLGAGQSLLVPVISPTEIWLKAAGGSTGKVFFILV